jgi:WD40 repeat protein
MKAEIALRSVVVMDSSNTETNGPSVITTDQQYSLQDGWVFGVICLPSGQRIITCSEDGSLRAWNLKNGKQIGEDWRDGESGVYSMALSPDGKKVASGSKDGTVRLWDIDTGKVIVKWTGHTQVVLSVCWSQDGRRVLSGSEDGTVRQWDVENRKTMIEPIVTGHEEVLATVYSPDMTMIATGGRNRPWTKLPDCSIQIWDAKTGKLVATLKGHTWEVSCLAWTKDGRTLISGSYDSSLRTWNTTKWEQTAVLVEHTSCHFANAIAISPNGRILISAFSDSTVRLWNLDNGQPISSPLQHNTHGVSCVSFSADGKRLVTGCWDKNAYSWDVAVIVREAGLDDLLSDSKVS